MIRLAIDEKLIGEARKLGGHRTKKEAVIAALEKYISGTSDSREFLKPLERSILIPNMITKRQGAESARAIRT
ncbi:MAG: type II toxin-antitoxin system VapB family antitoxin [Candidatus Sulfotelmatobacter sp.]